MVKRVVNWVRKSVACFFKFVLYCSFKYNSISKTKALFPYPSNLAFFLSRSFSLTFQSFSQWQSNIFVPTNTKGTPVKVRQTLIRPVNFMSFFCKSLDLKEYLNPKTWKEFQHFFGTALCNSKVFSKIINIT